MRLDLHVHTTASDGAFDPAEVIDLAVESGLDVLSITDHDTVAALEVAMRAAADRSVRLIPGIEVSSTWDGSEYHFLGYFVDPEAASVRAHERDAVERREHRMEDMVDRLRHQGLMIVMGGRPRGCRTQPFRDRASASGTCARRSGLRELGA